MWHGRPAPVHVHEQFLHMCVLKHSMLQEGWRCRPGGERVARKACTSCCKKAGGADRGGSVWHGRPAPVPCCKKAGGADRGRSMWHGRPAPARVHEQGLHDNLENVQTYMQVNLHAEHSSRQVSPIGDGGKYESMRMNEFMPQSPDT
eukprot:1157490-Pelagomonas_calceolata.AAC.10